jgi:hypothetical protein
MPEHFNTITKTSQTSRGLIVSQRWNRQSCLFFHHYTQESLCVDSTVKRQGLLVDKLIDAPFRATKQDFRFVVFLFLVLMLERNDVPCKAEIQAVNHEEIDFLTKVFLPWKLACMKWAIWPHTQHTAQAQLLPKLRL